MEITFSIIVPVYKVELYLSKCIESILSQNYKSFELILVDDGSPDSCPQICDEYSLKDDRVKVINKQNGGLSDARNFGIEAANGEYILFIDSDDYWSTPCVLEKINKIIQENNSANIIQFGVECFYNKDDKIISGPIRTLSQFNGSPNSDIISQLISTDKLSISACSMAISRKFIIENQLFFKKGIKTEDLEWAIRLFAANPEWAFSDEYFYTYRLQRDDSISASVDYKHLCDYCWILEKSIALAEQCEDSLKFALISYLMYHVLIATALSGKVDMSKSQRKEISSKLKDICKGRVTRYTLNKKVKLAKVLYLFGGFKFMSKALTFYLNNRRH